MNQLSIYIAAPYPAREAAIELLAALEVAGFTVTSTWLREFDTLDDEHARLDLHDVERADALVLVNPEPWAAQGTGGRHVEFGYAIAKGKQLYVLGERSNMFHHLCDVTIVPTVPALIDVLKTQAARG